MRSFLMLPAALVAVLSAGLASCTGGGDAASTAPVVADSAGVRVVLNRGVSFEAGVPEWRVSAGPEVAIGRAGGDEAYLFDRIMGVARLSDGRWAVADMGSAQVRYYSADGQHLRSVGRRGEGPGEFQQIMGMQKTADDVLIIDDARMRTHLLSADGAFAGGLSAAGSPIDAQTRPVGSWRDGTMAARTVSASPQMLSEPHAMTTMYHRAELVRGTGDALTLQVLDTLGVFETVRLVPGWRGTAQPIRMDGRTHAALLGDGVVVADPMTFEIRVLDTAGRLRVLSRTDWQFQPIDQAMKDRDRAQFIGMGGENGHPVPDRLRQQRQDIAETWTYAAHLPAFAAARVDDVDHVWLREFVPAEQTVGGFVSAPTEPARWLVMAPDGVIVGRVTLPGRFAPLALGEDFVAGVYRDDMDVEYVHSYRLARR
jgi:hypothetical protein